MNKGWRWGFLSVTAAAIAMELLAVFDNNDNTEPWTTLIITYIPSWIGLPLIGGFAIWLFHHFYKWYKVKNKK